MNNMNMNPKHDHITTPVIECRQLSKSFQDGRLHVDVLRDVNLSVKPGEQVAILGSSGAGKSTLLHLLGGLDKPSKGEILLNGQDIRSLSEAKLCRLRNEMLGFVYQFHHLLPEFSVLENVCMPLLIRREEPEHAKALAMALLHKVGLANRVKHRLAELSGGERQRTAIARALVTKPACVLADEPTGNLDFRTADKVYETMLELNRSLNTSLIIVTHDPRLAEHMDRRLTIVDGQLQVDK